jgi:hypothetical protein
VFLSRHVVFDEKSFPAADQAATALPSKISAQDDVPFHLPVSLPSSQNTTSLSYPTILTTIPPAPDCVPAAHTTVPACVPPLTTLPNAAPAESPIAISDAALAASPLAETPCDHLALSPGSDRTCSTA